MKAPQGLSKSSKALFKKLAKQYKLKEESKFMLENALLARDRLDEITAKINQQGMFIDDKPNPLTKAENAARSLFHRAWEKFNSTLPKVSAPMGRRPEYGQSSGQAFSIVPAEEEKKITRPEALIFRGTDPQHPTEFDLLDVDCKNDPLSEFLAEGGHHFKAPNNGPLWEGYADYKAGLPPKYRNYDEWRAAIKEQEEQKEQTEELLS